LGDFFPQFCIIFDNNGFGYSLGDFSQTRLITLEGP
jgi:hypothetical protein